MGSLRSLSEVGILAVISLEEDILLADVADILLLIISNSVFGPKAMKLTR